MANGILDIYDKTCMDFNDHPFMEWLDCSDDSFQAGQFCTSVIWYTKYKRWYLDEANYDPIEEYNSTWYAKEFFKNYPDSNSSHVMKYFELEKDERLITTNSKVRPVILIKSHSFDWFNPMNTTKHIPIWFCIPLFSYKPRHVQDYVINQQRLNDPLSFYIPSWHDDRPGILNESAALFMYAQSVNENTLIPVKHYCNTHDPKMNRKFKLSDLGLRLLMYHFFKNINVFNELEELELEYNLFKEQINKLLDVAD